MSRALDDAMLSAVDEYIHQRIRADEREGRGRWPIRIALNLIADLSGDRWSAIRALNQLGQYLPREEMADDWADEKGDNWELILVGAVAYVALALYGGYDEP